MGKLKDYIVDTNYEEVVAAYHEGFLSEAEFKRLTDKWFEDFFNPKEAYDHDCKAEFGEHGCSHPSHGEDIE